jgi:hypothetical protein
MSRKRFIISLENEGNGAIDEIEISPEIQAISEDDMVEHGSELSENIEQTQTTINLEEENIERVSEVVDALEDLVNIVDNIEQLEPAHMALIQTTANMAVAGTDTPASVLLPSIESFKDKKLAIEKLNEKISIAQEGILDGFKSFINGLVDNIQYIFTFFELHTKKLMNVKKMLNDVKSKTKVKSINIKVRSNKYFRYDMGETVANINEYKTKLAQSVEFQNQSLEAVNKFVDASFLDSWKTYVNYIPGFDHRQNYVNIFKNIETFTESLQSIKGMKKETVNGVVDATSPTLLGMTSFHVSMPDKTNYNYSEHRSLLAVDKDFFAGVQRQQKLNSSDSTIEFTGVTLEDVSKVITECEKFAKELKKLGRIKAVLSSIGSLHVGTDTLSAVKGGVVNTALRVAMLYFFRGYRLMVKSSVITASTVASSYNFAKGTMDNALSFCMRVLGSPHWLTTEA